MNSSSAEGVLSDAYWFDLGMKFLNAHYKGPYRGRKPYHMRKFMSGFGCTPTVLSKCWGLLRQFTDWEKGMKPDHLLWTCNFLKNYNTEEDNVNLIGCSEKTYRKWTWLLIYAIADLEPHVIKWEDRKINDTGDDCLTSVDCTDVSIQEPGHFWKGWFSHKINGAGLRYEIAVSLKKGDIVWINGPYACGPWTDIKIFRDCLKDSLDKNERVEADDGYIGEEPNTCKTPGGFCSRAEGEEAVAARKRLRSKHETVNKRLKDFGILAQLYRHRVYDHAFAFRAVAVLVQLAFESGHPLFAL